MDRKKHPDAAKLRGSLHVSQACFADIIGVHPVTYAKHETGKAELPNRSLVFLLVLGRLARADINAVRQELWTYRLRSPMDLIEVVARFSAQGKWKPLGRHKRD